MDQTMRAKSKHATTASCLLDTALLMLEGMHREGDHRGGTGDVQNDEEDEQELTGEEANESSRGIEKMALDECEGVASSFGDLSTKGSLAEDLKSGGTLQCQKSIASCL